MKKPVVWIILLIVVVLGIYLNRAYAHIYNTLGAAGLRQPDAERMYVIESSEPSSKHLIYDALGDSLTDGVGTQGHEESYPYMLAQLLAKQTGGSVTLNYQAVPGITTSTLEPFIAPTIRDHPDIITVLVGVNDMHNNVAISTFARNYERILQRITTQTAAKVYAISIPRIGADSLLWPPYNYYFDWQTRRFNNVIRSLADKYRITYIDLYTPTAAAFREVNYYSPDLFHPSAAGYALWVKVLYDGLH